MSNLSQALQAVSIDDVSDDEDAAAAAAVAAHLRERAAEEDRRADETWRQLKELQRRREEEAEEVAWDEQKRQQQQRRQAAQMTAAAATATAAAACASCLSTRGDDEPDASGWTPREQRLLESAMRAHPAGSTSSSGGSGGGGGGGGGSTGEEKRQRWEAIASMVPGRSAREVVQRARQLQVAVRAAQPPWLLRLGSDVLATVLERLSGSELCACACVCKELTAAAHDDGVWMEFADSLPAKWAYSKRDRAGEPPWAYTLRIRDGLYGAWKKLNDHRAGACPYLCEIGTVERGNFVPTTDGPMDYRVSYGAICELVQLRAKLEDGLSHRVYKAVAEQLVALSANPRSAVPPDLHMTVREIYKTCYPGFGAGTGSGAFAPGLQAGGSSAKSGTSGAMIGKGTALLTKKTANEEMRKRLETKHTFFNLVPH